MSGDSVVAGSFGAADYTMFALVLVVSAAIGFFFACVTRGQQSSRDFLTGGRQLTALPVSLSLTASFMSPITVLSTPAEVYCFGAIFSYLAFSYILSTLITSEIFLPVFYRLALTSVYEYVELRFNRATRLLGTIIFIAQTILLVGIVIYGPALALSQVTDMDLWGGIFSTGIVCTLYCTLGGLKAVVWTDVFQIGIMLAGFLSVLIKSVIVQGGVSTIISDSQEGGRFNFLDFDINPLRRNTFWTLVIGGTFAWTASSGTNQGQVQRYVACKSLTQARVALYVYMLGLCTFLVCSVFAGMCLYSVYKDCDPWTAGFVSAPDELMTYLVQNILTDYPGLPGLFFAAVCSGSLSTVSTSINALAAVTLEDLIKPYTNMSEKHLMWLSKGLTLLYGLLCISMAGLASVMGGMMQAAAVIGSAFGGPILGLFMLGFLCPFVNSKGGFSGLLSGLVACVVVSVGSIIYPPPPSMTRPLPLSTEGCNFTKTDFLTTATVLPTDASFFTTTASGDNSGDGYSWQSPSYFYVGVIGTGTTLIIGMIVSLITGGWWNRPESKLMLMKEDTLSYHLYAFIKDRVDGRAGEADEITMGEAKFSSTNPAFCDSEMDIKSIST